MTTFMRDGSLSRWCDVGETTTGKKTLKLFEHVRDPLIVKPGVDSHPERIVHDLVRVAQFSDDPVRDTRICRLPEQVAAEEHARGDFVRLEVLDDVIFRERRAVPAGQDESEPAWIALRVCPRQDEVLLVLLQAA